MEISFKNKTVIITGASEGIGFAAAAAFGKSGANVAICGRNAEKHEKAGARCLHKKGGRIQERN